MKRVTDEDIVRAFELHRSMFPEMTDLPTLNRRVAAKLGITPERVAGVMMDWWSGMGAG